MQTQTPAPSPSPSPAASAAASPAEAFVSTVHRTVLPNGLTVLTREQKGSGVVAINTWVKAGYFNEPDEVAGMAHLFEHMFFKGSKAFPQPESIAQAISSSGGVTNAGTIYDSTNYYVVLPSENFEKGVEIQADAIANPIFDPAELKKEAEVVIEESNRKFDNAAAMAFERMLATAYTEHRIRRWRIGSNEVLRNINRDDLMAFFETLYRPENIIVTVAGDVTPEKALAAVQKHFGGIPRGTLKKERGPKEPPQTAFRFGRSEADIKQGYTVFGWHTVPENHPDEVTLEVLAGILGGGRSSRLYRAVVNPTGASTISAGHLTFDDVGLLEIDSSFDERNRANVDRGIVQEVERMKQTGPSAYELALAKNATEVGFLGQMETALGQAQVLSSTESRGSYKDIAARLAQLNAVTADQVRDAARKYLTVEKMTLYHYQPKGAAAATLESALAQVNEASVITAKAPDAVPLPSLQNSVRNAASDSGIQTFNLSNGATLVVQQRAGTPIVSTGIYFRGGRTQETEANAGITRLMQAAMRRGTTNRTGEEIDRQIEFLGTQIAISNWEDGFGFTFESLGRFFEPALEIAADVVLNPSFPADGVTREKSLQLAAVKRTLDSSTERPLQLFRAAMYGKHPYGLPDLGTEASINAASPEALRAWWTSAVAADRALIVVVGNANAEDVRRAVESKLAGLRRTGGASPAVPPLPSVPAQRELIEPRDRRQSAMIVAFPAVPPSHPDYPKLRLLQSLTSGLSGTFFAELRSRQSLAYTVFARPQPFAGQGAFLGYLACDAAKEEQARNGLLTEIRKLQNEGVQEADLARAKSFFSGATRIARESSSTLTGDYGRSYVLTIPLDNTDRTLKIVPTLTVDDLRTAARKYFSGNNFVYAAIRGKAQ